MGKNAAHKQQQRARHGGADEAGAQDVGDGTVDASFHSPAWHAARIAALTTERVSWEDFKKQQKEAAGLEASAAANEEEQMRKYRAQLDADRAAKLAKGTHHAHFREKGADDEGSAGKKRKHSDKEKSSKQGKDKDKDKKHRKHKEDGKEKSSKRSKDKKHKSDGSKAKHRKEKKRKRGSSTGSDSGSESLDSEHP